MVVTTFQTRWDTFMRRIVNYIGQDQWEMGTVYGLLSDLRPRVFVEIGVEFGGSFYVYAGLCAPGATVVSIDLGNRKKSKRRVRQTVRLLRSEGFDARRIWGDSQCPETLEKLTSALAGRKIDLLHIDGDHSVPGFYLDWVDYTALMARGGAVIVGDVFCRQGKMEVFRLWPGLRRGHRTIEIVNRELHKVRTRKLPPEVGIGIIWL